MDSSYLALSYGQVGLASLLILVCGVVSVWMKLNLERRLLLAAIRTILQLWLIGLILEWVFSMNRWYLVLLLASMMTLIAGDAAVERSSKSYRGIRRDSFLSIGASAWVVTAISIFLILRIKPWYFPRYLVPMLGMILGNSLNGIALGLDRFTEELVAKRGEVDDILALGGTRWEAARAPVRVAVRTGMIPMINSMMVVGIVSIPGMMTGQLLGGVSPIEAVKYQIVIMFLLAAASTLGTLMVVLLGYRRLFNRQHQFLFANIISQRKQ